MKNSKSSITIVGLLCIFAAAASLSGCGQGAPPAVVQANATQVDNALKMRQMFVKAGGNYDSLSPDEKATYNQLAGGAAAGQQHWKDMGKNPVTGPTPGSADPRAGMAGAPGGAGK